MKQTAATIEETAIKSQVAQMDAEQLKAAALIGLTALNKVKMTIRAGLKECEPSEWLFVAQMVIKQCDEANNGIDRVLGLSPKAPIDHTDLTQDVVGINPLS